MKAMLLRCPAAKGSKPLEFGEIADPRVGAGELLVRVTVCGVCRTDLHEAEGELPMPMAVAAGSSVILGHQVVGRVA
jgi:propanol-preferring alcohol dehydrogenase